MKFWLQKKRKENEQIDKEIGLLLLLFDVLNQNL